MLILFKDSRSEERDDVVRLKPAQACDQIPLLQRRQRFWNRLGIGLYILFIGYMVFFYIETKSLTPQNVVQFIERTLTWYPIVFFLSVFVLCVYVSGLLETIG